MQANKVQIKEHVIARLQGAGLRCPFNVKDKPREFGVLVDEYIDAIYERQLSPHALHDGMTDLVRSWKYARWPTIGELLDILKPAPIHDVPKLSQKVHGSDWVKSVMRSEVGRRALDAGVGTSIEAWCFQHPGEKIPDGYIETQIAARNRILHKLSDLQADYMKEALERLWTAREGREARLKEIYECG